LNNHELITHLFKIHKFGLQVCKMRRKLHFKEIHGLNLAFNKKLRGLYLINLFSLQEARTQQQAINTLKNQ
jgi:hypothetical protein